MSWNAREMVHERLGRVGHVDRPAWKKTAEFVARSSPKIKENVLCEAEAASHGQLVLPGTGAQRHFVGDPPNWFANPVNNKEFVWTLNRLEHWKTLLRASLFDDHDHNRYSRRVTDELKDWLSRCRRPELDLGRADELFNNSGQLRKLKGPVQKLEQWPTLLKQAQRLRCTLRKLKHRASSNGNGDASNTDPWRSLEAGMRMFDVWPLIYAHLLDANERDPKLFQQYEKSAAEHAEVLATISPMIWPDANHNHYLSECLGLLTVACLFPELENSPRWIEQAMKEIERCGEVQLTEDGAHIEGAPHYHNLAVYLFCRAWLVARGSGLSFSNSLRHKLRLALRHCVQALRPSGQVVPLGDSDPDQLAVRATLFGYLCFGDMNPLRVAHDFCGHDAVARECIEYIWHVPDAQSLLNELQRPASSVNLPLLSHQRQVDQVTMRSSWQRDAISLMFTCRTPVYNGHAHADPCSFDLTAFGEPLLVDPGRFTYDDNKDREHFKSAAWHNCLTVNRREPFVYVSSWRFGPQKPGHIVATYEDETFMAAEAMHQNYSPAEHRRLIALIDGEFVLVLDHLANLNPRASVQLYFHLNTTNAACDDQSHTAEGFVGDARITVATMETMRSRLLPGRVSEQIDVAHPSLRLCMEDTRSRTSSRMYATLIAPSRRSDRVPLITDLRIHRHDDEIICRFQLNRLNHTFAWAPSARFRRVTTAPQSLPAFQHADALEAQR